MFLNDAEIIELTGYIRHADQRRWLTKRGWKHEISANGRPIISKSYTEAMLSDAQKPREWAPNLSAFKRHAA